MVQAWFMDSSDADQRLPHQLDPPQPVSIESLAKIGVLYFNINVDDQGEFKKEGAPLDLLRKERGYSYEDTITVSRDKLPNYDEKIKSFFEEHLHTDEEIRFIHDGSGYFDVRDGDERWVRIKVVRGDLIVLPAGIYHRFTLDTDDYIVANRLFVGEPIWKAHNRPADDMPARSAYIASLAKA